VELPEIVRRLPGNERVRSTSLKAGDRFVMKRKAWTVLNVKADGLECTADPTLFVFDDPVDDRDDLALEQ